jgi:hypothetical protein
MVHPKEPRGMGDVRKSDKPASMEKIFDRLTLLVMKQEFLLSGAHGPLNEEQKAILADLIQRSHEIANLLRENPGP